MATAGRRKNVATKEAADTTPTLDGRRPDIEKELSERYNVEWTYVPNVSPTQFDRDKSLHNQARFEPLDPKTVELYREAVKRGDQFPPVIAYRPGPRSKLVIIDGNHRLVAHLEEEAPLDVYEIASDTRGQTIALMTFSFNTKHGRPTSEAERIQQATYLVDNGASAEAAAAAVNLSPRILKKAIARTNADRRADEAGIKRNEWDTLSAVAKQRLANIATDEGFAEAASLAFAAKLDANEVFELVGLVNATKSGTKQRAIVKHKRQELSDRIQANAGGVLKTADRRSPSPKVRLSLALGQLLAIPNDDNVIVNAYAEAERKEAAERLRETSKRLTTIAEKLEASRS